MDKGIFFFKKFDTLSISSNSIPPVDAITGFFLRNFFN